MNPTQYAVAVTAYTLCSCGYSLDTLLAVVAAQSEEEATASFMAQCRAKKEREGAVFATPVAVPIPPAP